TLNSLYNSTCAYAQQSLCVHPAQDHSCTVSKQWRRQQRDPIALQIKRSAIDEMNKGKSIKEVASMFAVDTSTVRYWKRNKGKSLKYFEEQRDYTVVYTVRLGLPRLVQCDVISFRG
ncbi:hypothetical protein C0J52_23829, partial [Blattella germanica]